MRILDTAHLAREAGSYALFGADGYLYTTQAGGATVSLVHLPNISTEGAVKLYVHEPWVCVTERFGIHATLVNLQSGSVREMSRGDYCANVSSYSSGFLERDSRVLLICQTDWNRLDILDAETGEYLTDREVYYRTGKAGCASDTGDGISSKAETKNYLDYFHSLLQVSPNGEYFLSTGWEWHPIGRVMCFRTDDFLKSFELSGTPIEYYSDYNWDFPCAFISDDLLAVATDDMRKSGFFSADDLASYTYRQLQFYRLSVPAHENNYGVRVMTKEQDANCSVFPTDNEGKISGELVWDAAGRYLVAITVQGAYALNLEGEVLDSLPECNYVQQDAYTPTGPKEIWEAGWHYSPEHHLLYRWSQETATVQERRFDCIDYKMHDEQ